MFFQFVEGLDTQDHELFFFLLGPRCQVFQHRQQQLLSLVHTLGSLDHQPGWVREGGVEMDRLRPGSQYNANAAFCFVSSSTVTDGGIELWSIPPSVTVDDGTLC